MTGMEQLGRLVDGRLAPLAQRLLALRRRFGHDPVVCRACGWGGDRSACDGRPAGRPVDWYALPGAAWRGASVDVCPVCGDAAVEQAPWCPVCRRWGCECTDERELASHDSPEQPDIG